MQGAERFRVVVGDVFAHQFLRAHRTVLFLHGGGGDMQGAEPTSQRNQMGEVGVAEGDEFFFDILLGGSEFF